MTAGKPVFTNVTVGGIDVTSFVLTWESANTSQATINECDLNLHFSVASTQPLLPDDAIGLEIIIKRGVATGTEDFVFRGFITQTNKEGNIITVLARDKLYTAVQANVTKTFANNIDTEAGKISEIFKTLINDFTDLTADNSSVDDSGTDIILERFFCNNADVFERCELLAEFLRWQLYYNAFTDKVHFEPEGARANIGIITVGTEITDKPMWIRDGTKKVKTLKVFGGPQEVETTETFSGDDSETEFVLTLLPVSVKIFLSGVIQKGEVEGTVVDADYSVDPGTKTITFRVPPPIAAGNVEIRYSYLSPIALTGQNSITFGLDLTIRKPELTTITDVENFATIYLLRHSVDFIKANLPVVDVIDMDPGQSVTVVDVDQNINQSFFIKKVKKSFPYITDEIEVDSEELRTEDWEIITEDRLRRIEERLSQEESVVFIIRNLTRDLVTLQRRYLKFTRRDITGSSAFVLGSSLFGILGTSKLGGTVIPFDNAVIQQGGNIYTEDFHDTDFKDVATTATWSSTLDFTSGQVGLSTAIDFNNGVITVAKITVTSSSGTFTIEMSANGGTNYQTVTSGSSFTFTNSGTDLRWRITESGASTGTITEVLVDGYH